MKEKAFLKPKWLSSALNSATSQTVQFPFAHKGTFDWKSEEYSYLLLSMAVGVFFLPVERCGFEPLQEINLSISGSSYISNQNSPPGAGL